MNKVAAALLVLSFALPVLAQEVEPPKDDEKTILLEKTIYVPFDEIDAILQKEGRSVYLPYEEFVKLWRKGEKLPDPPKVEEPPSPVVLRAATYEGAVAEGRTRLVATLELESLAAGWSELALPFAGVAIESVELTDERAVFAARKDGYALYLPKAGDYGAKLAFSLPVEEAPGKKSIRLRLPTAAVSRVDLTIPEKDLRIEALPKTAMALTQTPEGHTRASIFLGQVEETTLSWAVAAPEKVEESALVFARQAIRTHLGERTLRIETAVHFEVMRGEVDRFELETPKDCRVISVEGESLKEWGQEGERLWVRLHSPLSRKATYSLALAFERILDETPSALAIPMPRTLGTLRESGHLVLSWAPSLDVRPTRAGGLSQLDPDDVPEALRPHLGLGFAYLAHPLDVQVAAERIVASIQSQTTSVVVLGPEEDVWSGWIDYEIKKTGVFQLAFAVGASWSVASVGTPETVEEFQVADAAGKRTVTVQLRSKALGAVRLPFRLTRLGTAAAGAQTFSPPEVVGTRLDRGLLGVAVPKKMEARTTGRDKVTDADREELIRSGALGQLGPETGLPLAWRYREQPASVRLDLSEKARQIDVLASHLVEVGEGQIRTTHWLDLDVLYAPTDVIRFRAPASLDDVLKIEVKDRTSERKVSAEGGWTLWEVHVAPPVLGSLTVTLTHTHDLTSLAAGQSLEHVVPIVHAADVTSETGFLAIRKEGTLEVVTTALESEPVDEVDLPARLRQGKIDAAFRYYGDDPSVVLSLTRHDYQKLATTVVDRIHVRSVLTRERKLRTKAVLTVQNVERQFLELAVAPTDVRGLTVAGRSQPAKKAPGADTTLVEIPRSAGRTGAFEVVVDYEEALAAGEMGLAGSVRTRTLELVGDDVPVGRVDVELYLPPEYRYLSFGGNLREAGLARTTLWTSYERLFAGFFGSSRPEHGAPMAPSRTGGSIEIDLPTEGLVVRRFDTLAAKGELGFWFLGSKTYAFLQILVVVVAIALVHRLLARHPGCDRAWQGAVLSAAVPFVLQAFVGGALGEFLAAASLGAFVVVVGHGGRRVATNLRESREAARGGDPYLDAPAPTVRKPVPSDVPPTMRAPSDEAIPPTIRRENEEGP